MVSDFGVLAFFLPPPKNPIEDSVVDLHLLVAEELSALGWLHARHSLAPGLKPVATEVPEAREKSCVAAGIKMAAPHSSTSSRTIASISKFGTCPNAAAGFWRARMLTFCAPKDRPLQHINKKGRPVSQCQHCRSMRKSRSSHVKCDCGEKTHKCIHLKTTVDGHKGELHPRSGWLAGLG